jgi:DNA-directed RNA polymerase subunit RPC12/RpoP
MSSKDFTRVDYHEGIVRSDCDCTNCRRKFIAKLNYDIDGDHRIVCPYCQHIHYRTIKKGVVTTTRWANRPSEPEFVDVKTEKWWRDDDLQCTVTTVAGHIRERFLNKENDDERT